MQSSVAALLPLFATEREAGRAAVLALVTRTEGSTYGKAGALLLIAADGRYAGLISGGCLEGDLREHARAVADGGAPRTVSYDMRGPDDLVFGLGAGCEGAMDVFLLPVGPASSWEPLASFASAAAHGDVAAAAIVVDSLDAKVPPGSVFLSAGHAPRVEGSQPPLSARLIDAAREGARRGEAGWTDAAPGVRAFVAVLALPPRILLLGAGPDAKPVHELANFLGWRVTVVDHRAAYATAERFPLAESVVCARPSDDASLPSLERFQAVVVMSHHLPTDLGWLRVIARSSIPYVGLLGPAARRERLLADLGEDATALAGRLRAPIGLDIGGRAPESIALSIVAEIHAALEGRPGGAYSGSVNSY
jgi:xanthine/CO dehydrogenase XdhC/CoxF family maturation factor